MLDWLQTAFDLAVQAGRVLQAAHSLEIETKDGPADLVTRYDKQLQLLIQNGLAKYKDHAFIGEESPYQALDDRPTWIVDPIGI